MAKKVQPQLNYRETRDPMSKGIDQMIAAIPDRGSVKPKARKPPKPRTPPPQVRGGVVVTKGPGSGRVGGADTSGPGLGVVTPYITADDGHLIPTSAGSGPGNLLVRSQPGNGVAGVVAGGLFGAGTGAPEKVTEVYIGGNRLPRDPGTSDAQEIEDAYGEAEFLSPGWFINWGAAVSNFAVAPVVQTFHDTGDAWRWAGGKVLEKMSPPPGELERRRDEYLRQGGGKPGQIPW